MIDSEIIEGLGRVRNLNLVLGSEKTEVGLKLVVPKEELAFDFEGIRTIEGKKDRHWGHYRTVRSYQAGQEMRGTRVRNERQVGVVLAADLLQIAEEMKITELIAERGFDVIDFMSLAVAANVVVEGALPTPHIEDFVGPNSRLYIGAGSRAVVNIFENHLPCSKPANAMAAALDMSAVDLGKRYKEVAANNRGLMGWVWAEGTVEVGDPVGVQLPVDFKGMKRAFWQRPEGYEHP